WKGTVTDTREPSRPRPVTPGSALQLVLLASPISTSLSINDPHEPRRARKPRREGRSHDSHESSARKTTSASRGRTENGKRASPRDARHPCCYARNTLHGAGVRPSRVHELPDRVERRLFRSSGIRQ